MQRRMLQRMERRGWLLLISIGEVGKEEQAAEAIFLWSDIRYTQKTCSNTFRGGPYRGWVLDEVLDKWVSGENNLDPESDAYS